MFKFINLKKHISSFIPIILFSFAILHGGRGTAGLAVFYLLSLFFLFVFLRIEKPFFTTSVLDLPIGIFFVIITLSTIASLNSGAQGIIYYFNCIIYILLFYLSVRLRDHIKLNNILLLYLSICSLLSLTVLLKLPISLFTNPNLLAGFMAPGIIISVCFIASDYKKNQSEPIVILSPPFGAKNLVVHRKERSFASLRMTTKWIFQGILSLSGLTGQSRNTLPTKLDCPIKSGNDTKGQKLASATDSQLIQSMRVLPWLALALITLSQVIIFSRGAITAVAAGLIFLSAINFRRIILPIIILISIILSWFILSPDKGLANLISYKFFSGDSYGRAIIWKSGINAFTERPLTGWGIGKFEQAYLKHKIPQEGKLARYDHQTSFAHNEYLDCAVQTGIFGLGAFLFLIFMALRQGIKTLKTSQENYWFNAACISGVITILTHSFFDFNLHLPAIAFLLVLFVSLYIPVNKNVEIKPCAAYLARKAIIIALCIVTVVSSSFISAAKGQYSKALFLNPFNKDFWLQCIHSESNYQKKESLLKNALKIFPGDSEINAGYARYCYISGNPEKSIEIYLMVLLLDPYNPFIYSELGDVYYSQKEYKEAEKYYAQSAQLEPAYIYSHFRIAEIFFLLNEKDKAASHLDFIEKIRTLNLPSLDGYTAHLLDASYDTLINKLRTAIRSN